MTPQPTVLKNSPRKKRKLIVVAVASFILFLITIFVVQDYREWTAIKAVNSYEACAAAKGSTTSNSCPLSCTTRYKDKFIDSSPCPEPTLDAVIKAVGDADTINSWKIFADDNITFRYPADGVISKRDNSLVELTYSPSKYRVRFTFHPATKQSLDKYLTETYLPDADGNHTTSPLKQVQIAGYRGFAAGVYAVDSGWFSYIVLESPDAKANVDIEYFTGVLEKPADKAVFYQILATFKFLDQVEAVDTSSWKTYTNQEYGFEFKYPQEYFTRGEGLPASSYSTLLVKISNSQKFDDDEFALVIEAGVENPKFGSSPKTRALEDNPPLQKLSVTSLEQRLKTKIYGSFFGNPPWGVYELEIPLPTKEELYLRISARTHSRDEAERNSRDLEVFDQVLATLRFLD